MERSHNRLRGRIVEKYGTIGAFAKEIGKSRQWTGRKVAGNADFTAKDIRTWSNLLEISPEEIGVFFYSES